MGEPGLGWPDTFRRNHLPESKDMAYTIHTQKRTLEAVQDLLNFTMIVSALSPLKKKTLFTFKQPLVTASVSLSSLKTGFLRVLYCANFETALCLLKTFTELSITHAHKWCSCSKFCRIVYHQFMLSRNDYQYALRANVKMTSSTSKKRSHWL